MTFIIIKKIIIGINQWILDPYLENFDDFVDDLLTSDLDIYKVELDLLILQHIYQSIYLEDLKNVEYTNNDYLAA